MSPPVHPQHVYVNRQLDVTAIGLLGIDLDHTMAVYDDAAVNSLAFHETCSNLFAIKGFPDSVTDLSYRDGAVSRGLVADTHTGHIVKLDHRDRVRRAFGPGGFLDERQIQATYGRRRFGEAKGYQIHSPFDRPAGVLFTALLENASLAGGRRPEESLRDVVEMLDHTHRFGRLKASILSDPARFIRGSGQLHDLIGAFRDAGVKTIVLTNSALAYTVHVLDHLFPPCNGGGGWRNLFHAVVVDADKPRFFTDNTNHRPQRVETTRGGRAEVWSGGRAHDLVHRLGVEPARALYVGDNPMADCVAARSAGWRTAMVVPEIGDDPLPPDRWSSSPPPRLDSWGSIFWETDAPTRFTRVLREAPDVFAGRLDNLLAPGPAAVFDPSSRVDGA